MGISGGFATPLAAELIAAADLVVAWGASLTMWTTRHGALIGPDATVVQVDDDPAALGAQRPVHLGVLGDVGATARDVLAAVAGGPGGRTDEVAERIATEGRWNDMPLPDDARMTGRIEPRVLSAALDDLLPAERTLAVDSGNFMGYPSAYLAVPDASGFCFTQAFQSIGLGLATAIGAALARPDRLPVAALGDGGFLMGIAELETAVRLGLGMLVVVYDDAGYGAEFHHFPDDDHSHRAVPGRPTSPRSGRATAAPPPPSGRPPTWPSCATGSPGPGTGRCCWTPRSAPTRRPGGSPRRSRATDRRESAFSPRQVSRRWPARRR